MHHKTAPQDGTIKGIAITTVGSVVQAGAGPMTLASKDEQLYVDVNVKNEDVGFVQAGQRVQVKLAAYPFQRYGMLTGKLMHLSVDATEINKANNANAGGNGSNTENQASTIATYKARIQLDQQSLVDAQGQKHQLAAGMQVVAEINQGKRTVLEYLLSPVQKAVSEAGREQ